MKLVVVRYGARQYVRLQFGPLTYVRLQFGPLTDVRLQYGPLTDVRLVFFAAKRRTARSHIYNSSNSSLTSFSYIC